jgi:hypothetical protein
MITLLVDDNSKSEILDDTSFGGRPVQAVGKNIEWPKCANCEAEMQYLGKIKTDIGLEMIFMCNNDPGMCDEWDADGGGNKVIIIDEKNLGFFQPVEPELSLRGITYGVKFVETDDIDYDTARENWTGDKRAILGQLYGEPSWIQGDETPQCDCCNKMMRFVSQLEEGPDHSTAMNFGGGGVAYLFDCKEGKTAKFLWQC